MRVLVFGGRDFGDVRSYARDTPEYVAKKAEYEAAWAYLNALTVEVFDKTEPDVYGNYLPDITVISGCARGADQIGIDFATVNWTGLDQFPADWKTHGKAAGHLRNQQMLDSGVDIAVQFPGGKGTADMRRRLDKAGVKVYEFHEQTG